MFERLVAGRRWGEEVRKGGVCAGSLAWQAFQKQEKMFQGGHKSQRGQYILNRRGPRGGGT